MLFTNAKDPEESCILPVYVIDIQAEMVLASAHMLLPTRPKAGSGKEAAVLFPPDQSAAKPKLSGAGAVAAVAGQNVKILVSMVPVVSSPASGLFVILGNQIQ
jgi:hypothetical protein